jgi:CHAD domain-containing protein
LFDAAESTSRLLRPAAPGPGSAPVTPATFGAGEPPPLPGSVLATQPRGAGAPALTSPGSAPEPQLRDADIDLLPAPGIVGVDSLEAAGRKVMLFHLERLASSLPSAREGVPTAIEAASQATRHLRSAGRIFDFDGMLEKKGRIRRDLRRLDRRLAIVLVLDALLRDLDDARTGFSPDRRAGLDILRGSWRDEREAARRRLARAAAPRRCRRWIGALWDWLQDDTAAAGGTDAAMSVVHRVSSRVWDAYERAWASASLPGAGDGSSLPRLRTAVERLAHTLEAFGEVLPDAGTLLAAVDEFEGHIAVLVDAGLSAAMAREFARSRGTRLAASERAAIDAFVVSREDVAARQRASGPESWGSLFDPLFGEALGVALDGARR